ncbi:MAG: UDP-N-acetylmuramoyl-L-alanyl-D-glutamate--2,6-diaminopimelate ligase [Prevotella sp.]|nr:UDP-N-acetylmuramoyl-L-alanyl-D-glutamate--2,6-diaminopimelate ligase [Staphylococcus sp.]MCM1349630.1 UDP-N-acetylmuramoyl-L-alanyl-D-glutamate--2,6-diaminopimelate ligase [Prevotella sp.]
MKISEYMKTYRDEVISYDHDVSGIFEDSREVIENGVFIAIQGYTVDGKQYIQDAIRLGAKTIVFEKNTYRPEYSAYVNYIAVESVKVELARLLKWFYQDKAYPQMIGITGTNGKTTVSELVYQFLKTKEENVLYLGTGKIKSYLGKEVVTPSLNTTPRLSVLYHQMFSADYHYVVMEVSSQGIAEGRVLGIPFDIACLTNITQDHLDYHQNMDAYAFEKLKLALSLSENNTLILNQESAYYAWFIQASLAKCKTYSSSPFCAYAHAIGKVVSFNKEGMLLEIWQNGVYQPAQTHLIGEFNVDNILASLLIIESLDFHKNDFIQFLPSFFPVKGRMNVYELQLPEKDIYVVIDYAHTPDGVKNALISLRKLTSQRLITVIGCGGNRDQDKRPKIGKIVAELSDYAYFTEDNSRSEPLVSILGDIVKGVSQSNYQIIEDRAQAIDSAIASARSNDIIVLLGKGEETEIIGEIVKSFSDIEYIESRGGKLCLHPFTH